MKQQKMEFNFASVCCALIAISFLGLLSFSSSPSPFCSLGNDVCFASALQTSAQTHSQHVSYSASESNVKLLKTQTRSQQEVQLEEVELPRPTRENYPNFVERGQWQSVYQHTTSFLRVHKMKIILAMLITGIIIAFLSSILTMDNSATPATMPFGNLTGNITDGANSTTKGGEDEGDYSTTEGGEDEGDYSTNGGGEVELTSNTTTDTTIDDMTIPDSSESTILSEPVTKEMVNNSKTRTMYAVTTEEMNSVDRVEETGHATTESSEEMDLTKSVMDRPKRSGANGFNFFRL